MLKKIPKSFRNFYLLLAIPYVLYVIFFAEHNLRGFFKLQKRYNEEEKKLEYYQKEQKKVLKDLTELRTDKAQLERYAREKYMMKKKEEDLYIIIKEKNKK